MRRGDHLLLGLLMGILIPVGALFIYTKINFPSFSFTEAIQQFSAKRVLAHAVSLSAIINLAVFFIFIWLHKDHSARGVLGATIIYALFIAILKLF